MNYPEPIGTNKTLVHESTLHKKRAFGVTEDPFCEELFKAGD